MGTRTVDVLIAMARGGVVHRIKFQVACHPDTRIVEYQNFEIVSDGIKPVVGSVTEVTNRTNGTTIVKMMASRQDDVASLVARLRQMPNVKNVTVEQV